MLDELRVRDVALIQEAHLCFGPGLCALTGETGAGKTALLVALKLLVGERADTAFVRDGAEELRVEAVFSETACDDNGEVATTERLATRRVGSEGRSRCMLDDEMVTVKALAETLGPLVDLCGQHEHQSLLRPGAHLAAIDYYGGEELACAKDNYRSAFAAYHEAVRASARLEELARASTLAWEHAAFLAREVDAVAPLEGEHEALEAQLPRLRNGEGLSQAASGAYEALTGEGAALESLALAEAVLRRQQGVDPLLDALAERVGVIAVDADDLALELRAYCDGIEFDPEALERALGRLNELEGLKKRFGPSMAEVFAARNDAARLLEDTDGLDERRQRADAEAERTREALVAAADALDECRIAAGAAFAASLTEALGGLAMGDVTLSTDIRPQPFESWTQEGPSRFELLYQSAAGTTPRSLARIASGGELSRVLLAYKSLVHEGSHPMTLVFDEIDAGVGGATANAIASRLKELARTHQVIVVTHLAQVAALADDHWVVEKQADDGAVSTRIVRVVGEERVDEIARMLAGERGELAREHARQLLGEQR
ncbi:MAG: DNA repair protein RecN [Coriobacteriales bacterium]|jgi:DNA repair protein RecN (Recombination protein N)|nr:DNA repair protein RecN [Coriobacteriales bacterium]